MEPVDHMTFPVWYSEFLELGLPARASRALAREGYTVYNVREASDAELLRVPEFGKISLRQLREILGGGAQPSALAPAVQIVNELRGIREALEVIGQWLARLERWPQ